MKEALLQSYMRNLRFMLLTCLLLAMSAWWALLPERLLTQPVASCSADYAQALKK
jgi:hypothetical protein